MRIASTVLVRRGSALTSWVLLVFWGASTMIAQVPVVPKKVPAKTAATAAKPAPSTKTTAVAKSPTSVAKTTAPAPKAAAQPTVAVPTPVAKTATTTATSASTSQKAGASPVPVAATPLGTAVPSTTAASTAASSGTLNSFPTSSTPASAGSSPADPRAPVAGQGVGTFLWPGGWTLTAYGCFRTGTRLFCDFDTTNQNNVQVNNTIWNGGGGVNLVDDGGKITRRHNAFFVGTDGSQFDTAYVSPQPVRFIIEYDDVDQRYSSISLVLGRDRMQGIPITLIDPSQPAGRMPPRAYASAPANTPMGTTAPASGATSTATNGMDKANQAVDTANQQKKKAQDFWKSVQGVAQPH